MKKVKRELATIVLILVLAGISHAASIAPKKVSNLVMLTTTDGCLLPQLGTASQFTTRNMPDGSSAAFTVPDGQVLIVTDVDWGNSSGSGNLPRIERAVLILVTNTTITSLGASVAAGNTETVGGSFHFTNGVAVGPNVSLCIALSSNHTVFGFLRGYLVPDK